jgi:hypothetical protein
VQTASVIEGDPETPLLAPNDMAASGDCVRSYRQHKSVEEPQWALDFNGRPCRRNITNETVDFGATELNSSGFQYPMPWCGPMLTHVGIIGVFSEI